MFIEEPVLSENAEALRDIVNQTNTPIALGERLYSRWDFKHILAGGYVDIIQPDASHAGGITECRKIATLAESYDVALALHCPLAHCARRVPAARRGQLQRIHPGAEPRHPLQPGNDLLDYLRNPEVFRYEDGFVAIPQGPGSAST